MIESIIILAVFLALIVGPLLFAVTQRKPALGEDDTETVEGTHFMKG